MRNKFIAAVVVLPAIVGISSTSRPNNKPAANINLTPSAQNTTIDTSTTAPTQSVTPAPYSTSAQTVAPATTTTAPSVPASAPVTPTASAPSAPNCNPNYSPCIPNSSTDLDCSDIRERVTVVGTDVYRLDADHDGIGCESY